LLPMRQKRKEVKLMLNLDYKCMEYGQKIGKQGDENILRKSLGVLQEDGVYAMFLWIEDKDKEKNIRNILTKLLNEQEIKNSFLVIQTALNKNSLSFVII